MFIVKMTIHEKLNLEDITLEAERLRLRAFLQSDLNDFYEYASVKDVYELGGWKQHTSIKETQSVLNKFISGKKTFAIVLKSVNKVVGELGFYESTRLKDDEKFSQLEIMEIGYTLSKDYWGQGLIVEATKAVAEYCFKALKLDALICTHSLNNVQSKRVIEKSGFKYLKPAKTFDKTTGSHADGALYILRSQIN